MCSTMIKLNDLPPEVLEILFEFLDPLAVSAVSQVCKKFDDVVASSERVGKKLTLYMRYPQDVREFAAGVMPSRRRYRQMKIVKSRDRLCVQDHPSANAVIISTGNQIFAKLGEMITSLMIDWSNAQRPREASLFEIMNRRRGIRGAARHDGAHAIDHFDHAVAANVLATVRDDQYREFVQIIRHFTRIEKLQIFNVHLDKSRPAQEQPIQYLFLQELTVTHCDAYCFDLLSACNSISKLEVSDPWWNSTNPGIDNFEIFLFNQTSLQDLQLKNLQYPRLFQVDRTARVTFQLHNLSLKNVFFSDKNIAANFFNTQSELRSVDMQLSNEKVRMLDEMFWYNKILRSIVANNQKLTTINIAKNRYKLEDCNFLSNIHNSSVKTLNYKVTSEDKTANLFKVFIGMFPNLETLSFNADESDDTDCVTCFDEGTVLDRVESLAITNSQVHSLININCGALTTFEYVPGKTGEFIDDLFGRFFHCHRSIKHLTIGRSGRSYFFVSYNLCEIIVNFLTQLEQLAIYNFGEVNKSVKLLCNLRSLKTLTLSKADHQQFTAKTKVECARNDLELIPVDPPAPAIVEHVAIAMSSFVV